MNETDLSDLFISIAPISLVVTVGMSVLSCLNCSPEEIRVRNITILISLGLTIFSLVGWGIIKIHKKIQGVKQDE